MFVITQGLGGTTLVSQGYSGQTAATGLRDTLILIDTRDTLTLVDTRDTLTQLDPRDTLTLL